MGINNTGVLRVLSDADNVLYTSTWTVFFAKKRRRRERRGEGLRGLGKNMYGGLGLIRLLG